MSRGVDCEADALAMERPFDDTPTNFRPSVTPAVAEVASSEPQPSVSTELELQLTRRELKRLYELVESHNKVHDLIA